MPRTNINSDHGIAAEKWRYKVKSFFYRTLGLPTKDYDETETMKLLQELDNISHLFLTIRHGHVQSIDQPTPLSCRIIDLLRRMLLLIFLSRFFILIYFIDSITETILADPARSSKDRVLILVTIGLLSLAAGIYREWVLHLEKNGQLAFLKHLYYIQSNGFSASYLQINEARMNSFKWTVHLLLVHFMRFIKFWIIFFFLLFVGIRLVNPDSLATPALIGYSCFWLPFEGCLMVLLYPPCCLQIIHVLLMFILYFYKAQSLVDLYISDSRTKYKYRSTQDLIDPNLYSNRATFGKTGLNIASLNFSVIRFLNEVDHLNELIKYYMLINILLWSFVGDYATFSGLIYHIDPDLLSNYFSISGFIAIPAMGIVCFIAGCLNSKFKYLYVIIERHLARTSIPIADRFKAMEIFSRLEYHEPGFKAGDSIVLSKEFIIIYILENASTLLLMACDIKQILLSRR